ncbi:MAG TPA: fatty acid desaturase, partial [Saprospiraceae bacterium]|nr:fatty acid desaturase [Saprospiraceae bacterium]
PQPTTRFTVQTKHMLPPDQNVYRQLPAITKLYQLPDSRKATIQVLNSFLPFVVIWVTMYLLRDVSLWLTFSLAIVNAFFLVRIFIIQHDCGHQSFTASRKANNIIGSLCSFLTFIPYRYWAKNHNYHHGHNGVLDEHRDIGDINTLTVREFRELSRAQQLKYMIFRSAPVLFILGPMSYIFYNNRLPIIQMKGWEVANRSLWWNNFFLLAIHATLIYFLGWQAFYLVHFPILVAFGIIAIWFFYVQHQHEHTYKAQKGKWDYLQASIQGSSYYKLPKLFHWLSGNIGYHHIHHLNSLVPNYELARCHHENPVFDQVANALTFRESLRCVFYKLWDEDQGKMVTWREYFGKK